MAGGTLWGARGLVVGALVVLLAGCAGGQGATGTPVGAGAPLTGPATELAAAGSPTGGATAPAVEGFGHRPTAVPTSASPSRKPKPRQTPAPSTERLPPPPPAPAPSDCRPRYEGTQASRDQAKQALTDAAGRTYWPVSAPEIKLPVNLVKAVAWQESGWQSNIIACDGGIGLMQVMPDTATFVNNRFDQSYDIRAYRDNATLGANYLAWLVKYIGDALFDGNYGLAASNCSAELDSCLLNAVISAYNFGPGAVVTDAGLKIPNPSYVRNVRALMTECECLAF